MEKLRTQPGTGSNSSKLVCVFPGCKSYAVNSGYCIGHGKYYSGVSLKPQTEKKPIKKAPAKRSEKEKKVIKELKVRAAIFLAKPENHRCAIKSPVCKGKSVTVNHTRGRGANTLNEKDWEPACAPCNGYIEEHHEWAREHGHKKPRHHAATG